jgi:hypothetical protein
MGLRQQVEHYYNAAKTVQKKLRMITKAPWYVTSQTLHEDLNVPYITEVIQVRSIKHHDKIKMHSNTILWPLLEEQHRRNIVHLHPVAHCYFTFTFLSVFCAAYRCF